MIDLSITRESWGVVDDQIGTPTATADLAQAVLCAAEKTITNEAPWGTYHFSGGAEASWYTFASDIVAEQARYTKTTPRVRAITTEEYPTAVRRPKNSRLNSDLFASTFGYRGKSWQEHIPSIVEAVLADRQRRKE